MFTNIYGILTFLIVLTALFSYINVRFIKLPATIGIMLISLICSLIIIVDYLAGQILSFCFNLHKVVNWLH